MRDFSNFDTSLLDNYSVADLKIVSDKFITNSMLDLLSEAINVSIGDLIGLGFEGQVYSLPDQKCLKIQVIDSDDYSDITTSIYLKSLKSNLIANIYEVGKFSFLNKSYYYIIMDLLNTSKSMSKLFKIESDYLKFSKNMFEESCDYDQKGDKVLSFLEDFRDKPSIIDSFLMTTSFKKDVLRLLDILKFLESNDIEYLDFMAKNLGVNSKNEFCLFDISGYSDEVDIIFDKVIALD